MQPDLFKSQNETVDNNSDSKDGPQMVYCIFFFFLAISVHTIPNICKYIYNNFS